ncbi:hypothetical protein M409DRAFT_67733 [Zasmidium cellare ATCC 36951]|uniref:PH domain-containing protein n=1 Tax=Zasmidium cellare ATCC 36951 TaxID=1080233 RepID=A0A6A6CBQ4_ZASCE|nr:uncharacterized protein M409DRAFT_67733 [Zasmidium cellare ATCC 36951]KAF2164594.1 hypothetical protein M409DRAFT_67733 [Zasmidium cellare ATCC 36951]
MAAAAAVNGSGDPFSGSPHGNPPPLRYAAFDHDQFSLYSSSSPSSARRALEAHLKDTDRRIQDASRLGTTLVQQRKDLASKLKEVEQMQQDSEVPEDLREKLAELEREYNEVGRESARAFLPKSRVVSENEPNAASGLISGSGRESPTKISAPSRRQRNQQSNRVHDIEFATEISTSLLAQVRQLQAALAEKDEELKDTTAAKAQLESEATNLWQRLRHMDENEQKYKDENWNLETRLQEMETSLKESTEKESRMAQTLKSVQTEKAAKERELDDLKVNHDKLNEDHAMAKKVQEADLHGLRRDAATHESERTRLLRKIEELTSQNTELAKAVSYRFSQTIQPSDTDFISAEEGVHSDDQSPIHSEPPSPIKGTPARHGMLESETLKSSLNHAHRMIQNLKNTVHREKTEKIELKRMLQDARDELETRRDSNAGIPANVAKKRRSDSENVKFKRPGHGARLGAARNSSTEIIDEPDWEDQDMELTPSKARSASAAAGVAGAASYGYGKSEEDTSDAFETANERETTESEAFATGNEDFDDDTEGDATETESGANRTMRSVSSLSSKPKDRRSFMSTASTSADEEEEDVIRTPVQNPQQPKYRLRLSRGVRRSGRVSEIMTDSPNASNHSPSSSTGTPQPAAMQSLGDELDALDESSIEGTPASSRTMDVDSTPETQRQLSIEPESPITADSEATAGPSPELSGEHAVLAHQANSAMLAHEFAVRKPEMVDAGVMTEPWEPERIVEERIVEREIESSEDKGGLRDRAGQLVGGALAGFGLSRVLGKGKDGSVDDEDQDQAASGAAEGDELARTSTVDTAVAAPVQEPKSVSVGTDALPEPKTNILPQPVSVGTDAYPDITRDTPREAISVGTDAYPDPKALVTEKDLAPANLEQSGIVSQQTEPISPPRPVSTRRVSGGGLQRITDAASKPEIPPMPVAAPPPPPVAAFSFSEVVAQEIEPMEAMVPPGLPRRSSKRPDLVFAEDFQQDSAAKDVSERDIPGTDKAQVGAGFFAAATAPTLVRKRSQSFPVSERSVRFAEDSTDPDAPPQKILTEVSPNIAVKKPVADEGSQTVVSGEDIDSMLRNKNVSRDGGNSPMGGTAVSTAAAAAAVSAATAATVSAFASTPTKDEKRPETRPSIYESPTLRPPRRPASAGSIRNKAVAGAPPLPPDHNQRIAKAAQQAPGTPNAQSTASAMGPPLMPASAYKHRPKTPGDRPVYERGASRDSTTPRPIRTRDSRTQLAGQSDRVSHRTSVSSFASELDERFNITRGQIMYPTDVEPATDPRMIQAITQTMIGEYLWKYTRKAGRSETSSTRHRRFFWIHPYTRTLYWSEQDPSTAGKNMLKAKSVAIEAVRVVSDDNAYPPGLHRKSLVVITPGREIVFTAPTGQRHETWFNALSYLLLRTEREKSEAEDVIDQDDIDEFNPGIGRQVRRSISRIAGRSQSRQSRTSLSSYNSRTTRTSSPHRHDADRTLTQRGGRVTQQSKSLQPPTSNPGLTATTTNNSRQSSGSVAGRISSITSRFRPSSSQRARSSASVRRPDDPAQIYDASIVADSAEDLRAVIEQQEREADRLENVRACCDGKHDVGSLSKSGRHSSVGNRFGSHGHHSHSHGHGHSRKA